MPFASLAEAADALAAAGVATATHVSPRHRRTASPRTASASPLGFIREQLGLAG